MKKPPITDNYEFEGYLPDDHWRIGDVISHPQGDATEFIGNEYDIKAICQVPNMIRDLIAIKNEIEFIASYRSELIHWGGIRQILNNIDETLKKAGCEL